MNAEGYPIDNEPRMECALLFFLGNFTENLTFQAAILASTGFVLSASHGSDFFSLRSPQRPLA
jgi:hypothetical protein